MTRKERRIENLKRMHDVMCRMNDERAYLWWAEEGVPDCPSDDDYESIADDTDDYEEIMEVFTLIVSEYGSRGIMGKGKESP